MSFLKSQHKARWVWAAFAGGSLYFTFFWLRAFNVDPEGNLIVHHAGIWSDWCAHFTMGSSMAYRAMFLIESPFLFGAKFNYPFLANLLPAFFVRIGTPFFSTYVLFSLLFTIASVGSFLYFAWTVTGSQKKTIVGAFLFFLNGGTGFTQYFSNLWKAGSAAHALLPLQSLPHGEDGVYKFLNIIDSMVIPQRAFQLGFPITLFSLAVLYRTLFSDGPDKPVRRRLCVAAVALGVLPVIHPHSLLAGAFVAAAWYMWDFYSGEKPLKIKEAGLFWGLLLVGAAPLATFFLFNNRPGNGFITWAPGWYAATLPINWFRFWWLNWTFVPWAAAASLVIGGETPSEKKRLLKFGIPFFALFAAANLFLFQPWIWDNTKILAYVSVGFSILSATFLMRLWDWRGGRILLRATAVALFLCMTLSGGFDMMRIQSHARNSWTLYTEDSLTLAGWVRTHTSPQSIWLTSSKHNHWLTNLTGRQTLMAYPGWLWTYGLDFAPIQADVKAMFDDPTQIDLFESYGVTNVVVGPNEQEEFKTDKNKFRTGFKPIFATESTTVYEFTGAPGVRKPAGNHSSGS